jgi:hypothetical protein
MATSFATVADVAIWLKTDFTPNTPEYAQMERFLGAISRLIRKRRPSIDAWITAGKLDADWVRDVTCQVAARLLTASEVGAGYESEQYPEWSYRLSAAASAGLDLTDKELADLTPESEGRRGAAFSIIPG